MSYCVCLMDVITSHGAYLVLTYVMPLRTRLGNCQAALKVVPLGSQDALSLSHEGEFYVCMQPLWDVVVPSLLACGPDGEEEGYMLATRLVPRSRHLDPETDSHLLPQLQQALQAVHNLDVVHGDLRLQNILVEEGTGGEQRVWLIDFGHAERNGTQKQKDSEMRELLLLLVVN